MTEKTMFEKVLEFHQTFGLTVHEQPQATLDSKDFLLRTELMAEEHEELLAAMSDEDVEQIAKEAADLLYVVLGTCVTYGINIDYVFDRVHASNMSKAGPNGEIERDCITGKILKPATYEPLDMEDVMRTIPPLSYEKKEG